jgi:RHS repeat-associated protein
VVTNWYNGGVISSQKYDPWGKVRGGTGVITQTTISYTGQRLDGTGLLYYNARYYDPNVAKFVSADTIVPKSSKPQSLNRYSYVGNNPLKYTDPSGHCKEDEGDCWWLFFQISLHQNFKAKLASGQSLSGFNKSQLSIILDWLNKGTVFEGEGWSANQVFNVADALNKSAKALKSDELLRNITFRRKPPTKDKPAAEAYADQGIVDIFGDTDAVKSFIHEIGHVIDWRIRPAGSDKLFSYSDAWTGKTGWVFYGWWILSDPEGAASVYVASSPAEDFAETFTAWVNYENGEGWTPAGSKGEALSGRPNNARLCALITAVKVDPKVDGSSVY